jgi:hypothetical protein
MGTGIPFHLLSVSKEILRLIFEGANQLQILGNLQGKA